MFLTVISEGNESQSHKAAQGVVETEQYLTLSTCRWWMSKSVFICGAEKSAYTLAQSVRA